MSEGNHHYAIRRPVAAAIAFAIGATFSTAVIADEDPVRDAYVGPLTSAKLNAARTGFNELFDAVTQLQEGWPNNAHDRIGLGNGSYGIIGSYGGGLTLTGDYSWWGAVTLTSTQHATAHFPYVHYPTSDDPLLIDGSAIVALEDFTSDRDVTIGTSGAVVDTNGFDVVLEGDILAGMPAVGAVHADWPPSATVSENDASVVEGIFAKLGEGVLELSGNNEWNGTPINVDAGVLRGSAASLQTDIVNAATVEFRQSTPGTYSGRLIRGEGLEPGKLVKSGPGTLTMTSPESEVAELSILVGRVSLEGWAGIGSPRVHVDEAGTLDLTTSTTGHSFSGLAGGGRVMLGTGSLLIDTDEDANFAGSISGTGAMLLKRGMGSQVLSGVNSYYRGHTIVAEGRLALAGQGRLPSSSTLRIRTHGIFDISGADGVPEIGSLFGTGEIQLGGNTLSVGANDLNTTFRGRIVGAGGLRKTGLGTLTLTEVNDYEGGTEITGGRLKLSGDGALNPGSPLIIGSDTVLGSRIPDGAYFDMSTADGAREVASLSGGGTLIQGTNSLTVGRDGLDTTFSGRLEGQGDFIKEGSGTLTLTGYSGSTPEWAFDHEQGWQLVVSPGFTGAMVVSDGTLKALPWSLGDKVMNDASLTLYQPRIPLLDDTWFMHTGSLLRIVDYSGEISGSGDVIKEGEAAIWLRGRNSYAGGTTIKQGALIGNTDSLQGNITNDALLAFYQVEDGAFADTISGRGALYMYGPGVLTLSGTNTYLGGTAFSGTLRIDKDVNLGATPPSRRGTGDEPLSDGADAGQLLLVGGTLELTDDVETDRQIGLDAAGGTFDTRGHGLTINGEIDGPGHLTKRGAGTLILTAENSYWGGTTVADGRLAVEGGILGDVWVGPGGELGGGGLIRGDVTNHGRIARGDEMGEVRVVGDVQFAPGSVFTVKANARGQSDWLVLIGADSAADIQGGTVDVRAEDGSYRRHTHYTILDAPGGVAGQFDAVTSNLAFLTPDLAYDREHVYLRLTRNDLDYAAVARTPDQRAVAGALSGLVDQPGDAGMVVETLDGLSAEQARAAFEDIAAPMRTALNQVTARSQRAFSGAAVSRLGLLDAGASLAPSTGLSPQGLRLAFDESAAQYPGLAHAAPPTGQSPGMEAAFADNLEHGLWMRGYRGTGHVRGDGDLDGYDYDLTGALAGYDWRLGEDTTLGILGGYARPRYDQSHDWTRAHARQFGAYGRYRRGALHIDAMASYTDSDFDSERQVQVGALRRTAEGSFDGDSLGAYIEAGYLFEGPVQIEPLVGLHWSRHRQDAYTEEGAGALDLSVPENTDYGLRGVLGVRGTYPFTTDTGTRMAFEARAAVSHEFRDTNAVSAWLAGDATGTAFEVSGLDIPRNTAHLGVGIAGESRRNLRFYADLDAEVNDRQHSVTLGIGLRYRW